MLSNFQWQNCSFSIFVFTAVDSNIEWWPVSEVRAACTGAIRALCAGAGSSQVTGVVARRNVAALQRRLLTLAHTHATTPPTAFTANYHTALALLRGINFGQYYLFIFRLAVSAVICTLYSMSKLHIIIQMNTNMSSSCTQLLHPAPVGVLMAHHRVIRRVRRSRRQIDKCVNKYTFVNYHTNNP